MKIYIRTLLSILIIVLWISLFFANSSAEADDRRPHPSTTVTSGENYLDVYTQTQSPLSAPSVSTAQTNSKSTIVYVAQCYRGHDLSGTSHYQCSLPVTCGVDDLGIMQTVFTVNEQGVRANIGDACVQPALNQSPAITPALVSAAFKRVGLPHSIIQISPPRGRTLVNISTLYSTQASGFQRTVTLLGRKVQLDITPASFTWNYGDGTTVKTDSPGVAYRRALPMSAYLTHEYRRAATVTPSVATTWSARWRVNGGPWRPVDGTVTIPGTPKTLVVRTATPTLVAQS